MFSVKTSTLSAGRTRSSSGLCNNGHFDYIKNGLDSGAIGYLVSDNPARFSEISTKFVVGYDQIDWKAFERLQEGGCIWLSGGDSVV